MLLTLPSRPLLKEGKASPTLVPKAGGNIKSRKEGINTLSTSSPLAIHDDQIIIPQAGSNMVPNSVPIHTSNAGSSHAHIDDIIDVDAIDAAFVSGHKGGMSSIDSTGLIERKLYSALGEELSFHADEDAMAGIETGTTQGTPVLEGIDINIPAIKRKRQGTLGGERGQSPIAKMAREEVDSAQRGQSSDSPQLQGGVSVS